MIFSVLAFIALIVSICITDRKKSLTVQSLNCFFEACYDFYIKAYTGAFLSIFNTIRSFLFINKDKFSKILYFFLLILFETVIVVNCYYTWNGYISLFPTTGSIIRTYCLWQPKMKLVRISGIVTSITYGIYYIYYNSLFMILGYILLFMFSLLSIYKNDIKKR